VNPFPDLYDSDFCAWCEEQAALLTRQDPWALDWANLAEEIRSMARRDRRALASHLQGLMTHLLKWQYQPGRRQTGHSWRTTIRNHRRALAELVAESPSLQRHLPALLEERYHAAREDAADQTRLVLATFPEAWPWTLDQTLDEDFWPDAASGG
jgi:hypothetical protein